METTYKQGDSRWGSRPLGTSGGLTLAGWGCYVTALADVATDFGHQIDPPGMNGLLATHGGFIYGNEINGDGVLARLGVYDDIAFDGVSYYAAPADLSKLRGLCARPDLRVILEVDFNPDAPGVQTHFGVARSVDLSARDGAGEVYWSDPWTGEIGPISARYGDPAKTIQKFVVYRWTGYQPEAPADAAAEQAPADLSPMEPGRYEDEAARAYFESGGTPVNLATGILQRAALAWKRGESRGPARSDEYDAVTADGVPSRRQRFSAAIAEWRSDTGEVYWMELVDHPEALA